jgi:class 3 adenylate cyclase
MTTATATRRLAAILAADVVGYSRLMGVDEEGTHERFKAHLVELLDPKIREHRGRIVKTTGDGVLAEFASVVDAVRCAGEIQRAMADRDLDLAEERRLRFRVGVNLGDVIAEGGDIYGDGVNIAARLEGLAAPGGICVSGTVRDHIGDRLPYAFEDMGEQSVKNIARPVRVYALRPDGAASLPASGLPARGVPARPGHHRHRSCRYAPRDLHCVVVLAGGDLSSASREAGRPSDDCLCSADARGSGRYHNRAAARRAAPIDRRAAVRQPQQRPRPAIFRRRDYRGSDDRSVAAPRHVRDLAQYRIHLSEQAGRREADWP